jgi:hypothetical protein
MDEIKDWVDEEIIKQLLEAKEDKIFLETVVPWHRDLLN